MEINNQPSAISHQPSTCVNSRSSSLHERGDGGPSYLDAILHVSLFGVALAVAPLLSGCGRPHAPPAATEDSRPAVSLRVQTIQTRKLPRNEEVVGTVRTRHSADIAAKVSGRIIELPVHLGQTVKEGDLLVAVDTQEIQARLEQAEVALRQAELDYRRLDKLRQSGAATPSEHDLALSRFHSARAAVAEAKALLDHARITAPMSGVVAHKDADLGDLAMPGRRLLRLEDPLNLRLEADVPDSLFAKVKSGAMLPVRVDGVDEPLEGKVIEIAPVADPTTRTLRVKLDLPSIPGLRAGQFGRVAVPVADAEFLIVPANALVTRGQLEMLFVAVDGKAQMRIVRTGRALADGVEILAGLSSGESIVVENTAGLTDGQPLAPR